jgi:hypothetical protein
MAQDEDATKGHLYGEFDFFTSLQGAPFSFVDFPPRPDLIALIPLATSSCGVSLAGFVHRCFLMIRKFDRWGGEGYLFCKRFFIVIREDEMVFLRGRNRL